MYQWGAVKKVRVMCAILVYLCGELLNLKVRSLHLLATRVRHTDAMLNCWPNGSLNLLTARHQLM